MNDLISKILAANATYMNTMTEVVKELSTLNNETEWLTPKQVAVTLQMDENTIRKLCREKSIYAKRFGSNWRIPKHTLGVQ